MRTVLTILGSFILLAGVLVVTPWMHDWAAVRCTRYATGFSEQNFGSVRIGDAREKIAALLGQPLSRYYIVARWNSIPETFQTLAVATAPADAHVQEILEFSRPTNPRRDFRLVEVILNRNGKVDSTRDYVTD